MAFKNDSTPDLIAKSATVVQAFTEELYAYLVSLLPTPGSVRENHDLITASYTAYLAGDADKAQECEIHRQAVNQNLSILVGLAKAVVPKDPKVPEALGVGAFTARAATSSAALLKPEAFKVFFNQEGQRIGSCSGVKGAKGYQIWGCDEGDPAVQASWKLVAASPSCRGIVIIGLNPAKAAWVKIRAMRGNGEAGPWSSIVYLNPTTT